MEDEPIQGEIKTTHPIFQQEPVTLSQRLYSLKVANNLGFQPVRSMTVGNRHQLGTDTYNNCTLLTHRKTPPILVPTVVPIANKGFLFQLSRKEKTTRNH